MVERYCLRSEGLRLDLSPAGGSILGLWDRWGLPLMSAQEVGGMTRAAFPMMPICNRVAGDGFSHAGKRHDLRPDPDSGHYLHGDAWRAPWAVTALEGNALRMEHRAEGAPYTYSAAQYFVLSDESLRVTLTVENRGTESLPYGIGFHSYFPRRAALLQFSAKERWGEGAGHLPTKPEPPMGEVDFSMARALPAAWQNNVYGGWDQRALIHWPERGLSLKIKADPVFSALMLYAPAPTEDFFCFEPMSHLPDAVNRADMPPMTFLAPGARLSGSLLFTLNREDQRS